MKPLQRTALARRQSGAVLVVGLIFLALMTLIGVTAYSVATQEERMAGNSRDRARAFEAAEMALRDCERLLGGSIAPALSDAGTGGLYTQVVAGSPERWQRINWRSDPTRVMSGVPGVAEQPRCIVEQAGQVTSATASLRAELPRSSANVFRVTSRGVGASRNAVVMLQTSYVRE